MDANKNGKVERKEFVRYWLKYWGDLSQGSFDRGVWRFHCAGQSIKQTRLMQAEAGSEKGRRAFINAATRVVELLFLYDALLTERRQTLAFQALKHGYIADCGRRAAELAMRHHHMHYR